MGFDKYRVTFKGTDGWVNIEVDAGAIIPALNKAMAKLEAEIGVAEAIKFEPVKVEKIN